MLFITMLKSVCLQKRNICIITLLQSCILGSLVISLSVVLGVFVHHCRVLVFIDFVFSLAFCDLILSFAFSGITVMYSFVHNFEVFVY